MKKKRLLIIILCVLVAALVAGCLIWYFASAKKKSHEGPNQRKYVVEERKEQNRLEELAKTTNFDFIRFDMDVKNLDTNHLQEGIRKLGLKYHGIFVDSTAWHYPQAVRQMRQFLADPYFVELFKYVGQQYNDMSDVKAEIKQALVYYRYYFPEVAVPTFYTVVGGIDEASPTKLVEGFEQDGKMVLILHLDWYLGKDNKYYGGLPQYIRYQCDKKFLPIDCFRNVLVWQQLPNKEPITLLDNMVLAGKVLYFTELMFPNTPEADVFGYTTEQMQWAEQHHGDVWNYLIEKELIYSKDAGVAQHLVDVAPETKPFKGSPGRMGAYVGWKIVCDFMENNPEISLQQMMKMTDANELLKKSGYKPKSIK